MKKLLLIAAVAALGTLTVTAQGPRAGKAGQIVVSAGAPVNGTNEVQTVTFGASTTTGAFKLSFNGEVTGAITWTATDATLVSNVDAALEALSGIGTSGVVTAAGTVSSGIGTVTVTFDGGNVSKLAVATLAVAVQTTGGTLSVAETTPGVNATARGSGKGALLVDSTNGLLYMNTGTPLVPVWSRAADLEASTFLAAIPTAAVADISALTSAALTGGESPTEAEHNALQVDVASNRTKVNDLLAKLRTAGIVTP